MGRPLDLSPWYGKEADSEALVEATAFVMRAITDVLEELRGENALLKSLIRILQIYLEPEILRRSDE